MSRVEIDSDGRQVIIEHDVDLAALTAAAFDLWKQVASCPRTGPGSAGFAMEKAPQWDHDGRPPVSAQDTG